MLTRYHELLSDIPDNPFAQQLQAGFPLLRFQPRLEKLYCQYLAVAAIRQRRIAILLALVIWGMFVLSDFWRLRSVLVMEVWPQELYWLLYGRWIVFAGLASCVPVLLLPRWERFSLALTPAVIIGGAWSVVVINLLYGELGFSYSLSGLILMVIAIFFPLGMTFHRSLLMAFVLVVGAHVLGVLVAGKAFLPSFQVNSFYLILAVLVCACGRYLQDHTQREQFLNRHLLNYLAERDSLTGLHNRRSLEFMAREWLQQVSGQSIAVGFCLFDVDHFKAYNDSCGHEAGDQVLKLVAQALNDGTRRPQDIAARIGGEEFAVIVHDTNKNELFNLAEQLRVRVEALSLRHPGLPGKQVVTLSAGVAVSSRDDNFTSLYQRADAALYAAKHAGRNRVEQSE
ncbi:GGDEF domain-containing protein [Atopomonas sediminilitoris]|uniref:GGDEF domain-containing protein n=1 Tax=Atopomonas sediminilitoris TaxID=2919919 RepID=UPI001F4EA026|nr:GGDEF domain-containing protein [Atopomonas sediminilitoris]MCJ8168810.1 GGDEF domain-containing protein [Atopomonas sediminilitoris]